MARTGRPPVPLFDLTPKQQEFFAYCVAELMGGSLKTVPKDPHEAFRAGVAMSRQLARFSRARRAAS